MNSIWTVWSFQLSGILVLSRYGRGSYIMTLVGCANHENAPWKMLMRLPALPAISESTTYLASVLFPQPFARVVTTHADGLKAAAGSKPFFDGIDQCPQK
jgi:hypothetical protein